MDCAKCGRSNAPDSKFCIECGAAFAYRCQRCGADLPPSARFCSQCGARVTETGDGRRESGVATAPVSRLPTPVFPPEPHNYTPRHLAEKILTSRGALEGERKQVTVLFADVKSSMEIAEQLDPEEWHRIMDRFFSILSGAVHRFEGTVNQYTGDGIMALFGAPIAHEDHAQRACYAALHIQDSLRAYADQLRLQSGLNFAVRVGINSGEVVVGKIGDDLRMDYTAQGHVVGLAARMEQIAEPGKVYVTEHTAELASGYFSLRDLGETKIKGLSTSLRVHELLGVGPLRTRFDVSRARGLSKFVGRVAEMTILEDALESTLAGEGKAIGIVAQAGQGKSRLCYEFIQRCRARGVRVCQAQSVSHETRVPLLPVLQLMRSYFGIADNDDGATARDRVAGRILLLDPGLVDSLPILFEFLGIPDSSRPVSTADPATRMQRLADLLQRLGRIRGEREAVVFLLEDLHWMDDASAGFVKRILDDVARSRTLLVLNFRPELKADWLAGPHYRELALQPLRCGDIEGLLGDLLGTDTSLAALPEWLIERTAGNPFYVEEILRSLIEDGSLEGGPGAYRMVRPLTSTAVPPTVHAILAARIDRLPDLQKEVLQAASVIGKDFSESVLARILSVLPQAPAATEVEAALQGLVSAEFVKEESLYPAREFAFKHALTQEVAYGSQLSDKRRSLHAAAAQALEATAGDKLDEKAASIAHHWEVAGELLPAARWYDRAALWIFARDMSVAAPYWEKVDELASAIPDSVEARQLELSGCIGQLNAAFRFGASAEEAERLYERGRRLAQVYGDAESTALLESTRTRVRWSMGVIQPAEEPELSHVEDLQTRLGLMLDAVLGLQVTGKMREAFGVADQAMAIIQAHPTLLATTSGATLVGFRGLVATLLGRLDEAEPAIEMALQAARENGFEEVLGWACGWRATVCLARGELDAAIAHGRRALEIAYKIESTFSLGTGTLGLANALVLNHDFEEAVRICTTSLGRIRAQGAGIIFEAQILTFLGEAQMGLGDFEHAHESIERAVALSTERGNPLAVSRARIIQAELSLRTSGTAARAAIEADLDEAQRVIHESGIALWQPLVHRVRAYLANAMGDTTTMARERDAAVQAYRVIGSEPNAERMQRELETIERSMPAAT